jgi:hypothetical protein
MKRNGRNMKMPKDGQMYSNLWSQMSNLDRYNYLSKAVSIEQLVSKYSK